MHRLTKRPSVISLLTVFGAAILAANIGGWPGSARPQKIDKNFPTIDTQPGRTQEPGEVDTTKFPVVDYDSPLPTDAKERAKREVKSKKYNSRHAQQLNESIDGIYRVSHWDFPALPVAKSSAVIIGEITESEAHLSEDKTTIYSEFVVRIESTLKTDDKVPMILGGLVSVERLGGRVRFPSGKVVTLSIDHQDMPTVGRRYLLFLRHSSPLGGVFDDSLFIVTGYEFKNRKVFPLDKPRPSHPIMKYKGADELSLLRDLESALAKL
jgi:hypothetical protein